MFDIEHFGHDRSLFDQLLIRSPRRRAVEDAKAHRGPRLGGRKIDGEIELGRLLDRNFARLRPAQNLVDKIGGASKQSGMFGP